MNRTTGLLTCLVTSGLLLSGCASSAPPPTIPVADELDTGSTAPSTPVAAAGSTVGTNTRDCPDAALRWGQAERSPADGTAGWPVPGRFVETSSGTILEEITASPPLVGQTPLAGTRMTPDPSWPRDSVVLIDDSTGKVVDTIHVGDDALCAP